MFFEADAEQISQLESLQADGGEDGRIDWTGGADSTAQNLTESLIAAEVLKKPTKGPAKLNAAVSEALSRHGSYIVFCSHKFGGQKMPYIEPQIKLLESWATHPQPRVRQWARERISWIKTQT